MSIGRAISWSAAQDPSATAVVDPARSVTRAELDATSNRLARAYQRLGVGVDDLVAIGLPNGVECYEVCAGVWKAGAIPLPLSARMRPAELREILEIADPALLVGLEGGAAPCVPAGYRAEELDDSPVPDLHASSWKAPVSGGSTGRPKIILSGTPAQVDPTAPTVSYIPAEAVQLVSGPLHHSAPFLFSMRGLFAGHTLVVLPRFDARAALAAIERHRVTWALLVPTMMQRIWRLGDERDVYDLSSLESILHLGAPCPEWLKRAWIDWLGPERIVEIYAGTESAGVALINGGDWLTHPGSVGRAAPNFEFRVVDPDGEPVPAGTVGEILMRPLRGAGSTYRYLGGSAPERGGWDTLGDLGHLDGDGWLYLTDRADDMIICGAANVYPAEVEAVLDEHPAVRSSVVFGMPDEDLGEVPHAVVDTAGTAVSAEELLDWARERLEHVKVPRAVEVVDQPLRDDAGKVRRRALRDERIAAS